MPNFKSSNEGTWFYFDETNLKTGGVCLRELTGEELDRIERITVKHKRKPVRGVMIDVPEEDTKTSFRLTWDYCIVDWDNIQIDGQDAECNAENKVKLMNCPDFAKFVGSCISDLVEANKTIEEARVKNLKSSSSGKQKSQNAKSA